MACLTFTPEEASDIIKANAGWPDAIRRIQTDGDGLVLTLTGNIDIRIVPKRFAQGVLTLGIDSKNLLYRFFRAAGMLNNRLTDLIKESDWFGMIGDDIRIDLNRLLGKKVKGIKVKKLEFSQGRIRIEF